MAEGKSKGILIAVFVWLIILGAAGFVYKQFIHPRLRKRLEVETGTETRYQDEIKIAHDSFSGYCILRSDSVRNQLTAAGIKLKLEDDQADYVGRIKALKRGKVDMAVFTVDALIKSSARIGEFPATIVMIIDETKGADAIVAYKSVFPNLQALNQSDVRIVLTPDSPSETLARAILAHFALPSLPPDWWIAETGAEGVYERFKATSPEEKFAYVLWEPYVSRALENKGVHVLVDSSNIKGYIVDVLVARREFLKEKTEIVKTVVEAYLRAVYEYSNKLHGMVDLVLEDAQKYGERINREQAVKLVDGVQWKNTLENYSHFGLLTSQKENIQHLEDIIYQITEVLVATRALSQDPLGGNASSLFYDGILRSLQNESFHPGKKLDILQNVEIQPAAMNPIREDPDLPKLTDSDWSKLVPVGEIRVKQINFARGGARINIQSKRDLDALAKRLKTYPKYYLLVEGHARAEGDMAANRRLAKERAEAAVNYLLSKNISENRVHAVSIEPTPNGGSQSVSFVFYQRP